MTKRYGIRVHRRGFTVICTEFNPDPNTRKRVWYPFRFLWWKRKGGRWIDLGWVIRHSWDDQGKRRKLSQRDQERLERAKALFAEANGVACDQSELMPIRNLASRMRGYAAKEIAELSRKTYPR
jgi:hypothetical protein